MTKLNFNLVTMNKFRILLFPFALVYLVITTFRNFLYDVNFLKSNSFDSTIIGVGNLSLGGTGKTPFVEFLIKKYSKRFNIALISRGYKRKSIGFYKADSNSSPDLIGDEPFQIFKKFSNITVAVDKNRANAISKILNEEKRTNLFILDDSFQHRKVKPNVNIILTTFNDPFYDDCIFPIGNLRESKKSINRADIVVVTKSPKDLKTDKKNQIKSKLNIAHHQNVFFTSINYGNVLKGDANFKINDLKNKKILIVSGIANSRSFVEFFSQNNIEYEHVNFSDHHNYTQEDINKIESDNESLIITTEKDFQKIQFLERKNKWSYLEIETKFIGDEEKFDSVLQRSFTM